MHLPARHRPRGPRARPGAAVGLRLRLRPHARSPASPAARAVGGRRVRRDADERDPLAVPAARPHAAAVALAGRHDRHQLRHARRLRDRGRGGRRRGPAAARFRPWRRDTPAGPPGAAEEPQLRQAARARGAARRARLRPGVRLPRARRLAAGVALHRPARDPRVRLGAGVVAVAAARAQRPARRARGPLPARAPAATPPPTASRRARRCRPSSSRAWCSPRSPRSRSAPCSGPRRR